MTKTTNYQLPKWEKTDRVQMKDFNDMTATLDAALKANADAIAAETTARRTQKSAVLLQEYIVPATTSATVPIDISSIDWTNWKTIYISVEPITSADNATVTIFLNGTGTSNRIGVTTGGTASLNARYFARILLFPLYSSNQRVTSLCLSDSSAFYKISTKFSDLTTLYLTCSSGNKILEDTKLQILGER